MEKPELREALIKILGPVGLKSPKRKYSQYNGHLLIYNSNICVKNLGKVWSGDLDFTADEGKLKKLARKLNLSFYILKELDSKFDTELNPAFEKSLIKVTPHKIYLGNELQLNCERDEKSGKIFLKYDLSFLFKKDHE